MEDLIFKQGCERLEEPDAVAYITSLGFEPLKHQAWFEDQIDQELDKSENKTLPFDLPACFWQFTPTEYKKGNGMLQDGSGTFILHVAQNKFVDASTDSSDLADHDKLLKYVNAIIDLLHGYQFPCTAKPYLIGVGRDHLNRPVKVDTITFSWSGTRKKPAGVPA